jgi:3-hydroxyacyl-[acyl-carrier-protein] dehydratase
VNDPLAALEHHLKALPCRYQVLLIDRLLECVPGQSACGLKCVSVNEPYFQGHFPDYPVMPGVLVIEALVQLSLLLSEASGQGLPAAIETIDSVRFKRQIIPGDLLMLSTTMNGGGRFTLVATVNGETAAEARIVLSGPATNAAPAVAP